MSQVCYYYTNPQFMRSTKLNHTKLKYKLAIKKKYFFDYSLPLTKKNIFFLMRGAAFSSLCKAERGK
jgi:hypothetical protein